MGATVRQVSLSLAILRGVYSAASPYRSPNTRVVGMDVRGMVVGNVSRIPSAIVRKLVIRV